MRNYPGRRSARHLRLITLAVYALAVVWASAAHAGAEVLQSDPVLESEHSDQCPTLHADAVCRMGFHAELTASVHGSAPAAEPGRPTSGSDTPPAFGPPTSPTLARAPPNR